MLPSPSSSERDTGPLDRRGLAARLWRWTRLIIVLAMLAGLVIIAEPARLWRALAEAEYLWALAAVPFAFGGVFFDALRLCLLMKPHGFRGGLGAVLRTNLVVNLVSLFLPGTVGGGTVAWYRLSKPDQLRAQTFAALSLNTVLKLAVIAGAGALALALDARAAGKYRAMFGPLVVAAALPVVILFLMLWTGLTSRIKQFHISALPRFTPRRVHEAMRKVFESFETYREDRNSVMAGLVAGLGRKLLENFVFLFALYAVGMKGEIGFGRMLWIACAVELASMMPFTFAGLGLPQVTFVALLAAFSVGKDISLAAQVIVLAAMLPVYLSGAVVLTVESLQKRGVKAG